ncbi:integrase [Pantoea sp. CCBC3-3-1]|uniref:integrase n=1 Tax=Pantoea sp. CCBC3-3-1 TaxID=2490851 RepID=UPI0020C1EBA2|nr:integrase [Pantoea sp. CCBC3-3-1]
MMSAKANTVRRNEYSFNVQTLNGAQLTKLETNADKDYLVIDLGQAKEHSPVFNETIKVAMRAAMNAVLASLSMPETAAPETAVARRKVPDEALTEAKPEKSARAERNAQRLQQLTARILADSEWLTARELSEKANFRNTNPSAGPNRWKAAGALFAIPLNGKDNYPAYALDEGFRPIPVVKQVIRLFEGRKTPWGLAIWFGSENSWLAGRKPKDVLITQPQQVLEAAHAELDGGTHG